MLFTMRHVDLFSKRSKEITKVVITALLVRIAYICILPSRALSVDLYSWLSVASRLDKGENPYQSTAALNWPPLWMEILFVLNRVGERLHISLTLLIQTFLMVVEIGVILVLFRILIQLGQGDKALRLLMIGIALNPICVLQVCQHCNFDVLVALWILGFLSALIS